MKTSTFARIAVTGLLVFVMAPHRTYCQTECGEILEHGIFNISSTDSLQIRTKVFINWLSQSSLDSYQKALDTGGSLGIPIEDIPVNISGYERASDWHNYQASLQKLDFSDERNLDAFKKVVIAADQGIVSAWTTCVLNKAGEAHAAIEVNSDPRQFLVLLDYTPKGPPNSDEITDFAISPATVTCTPRIYTYWFWHTYIESQGIILNCTRQLESDAVQITGNSLKGPLKAKLGGISSPPPIAPPRPPAEPVTTSCSKSTFGPPAGDAISDGYKIGDQDVWHFKCPVDGTVTSVTYVSCVYSNGSACSHINPRPEKTGQCPGEPRMACVTWQTNDGNYKVVTARITYIPDSPKK